MRIQHNIMAMNAYRNYSNNTSALSKNLEKLSSGYKINRAGDDAAGLAISEKMRAQIKGLEAAQKNVKDGISLVKTAEGAMQEIQDMLNRMKYLATQSANGTYDKDTDRFNLQKEVDSLRAEINRIADSANFNGINLLDGKMGFGGSGDTTALTAPTFEADSSKDAAGVTMTVAYDKDATDAQKTAINTALKDATIKVTTTDGSSDAKFEASDKIKVEGLTVPTGYTATFKDADGDDADFKVGEDIDVAASGAGKLKAGEDLVITLTEDASGKVAGTITIKATKTAADGSGTLVSELKAAADDAADAAKVTGYEFEIKDAGTDSALAKDDSIEIDGKTYAIVDTETAGKIDVTTASTFAKQMAAAVELYNKEDDVDYTASYEDGKLTLTLKEGKTAPDTAPTVTITDDAGNLSAGEAKEVKDTGNGGEGGNGEITLQIGDTADKFNQLTVRIGDMHTSALGKRAGTADKDADGNATGTYTYAAVEGQSIAEIDISTLSGAQSAIDVIKNAINYVSSVRGDLGATQNRLEHTANNLSVMTENIQDAESTIRDTDVAEEMMRYTKNNILIQSAQAMLAQANAVPQGVLQLLG